MIRYPELAQRSFVISSFGRHITPRVGSWVIVWPQTAFCGISKGASVCDICFPYANPVCLCRIHGEKRKYLTLPDFYQEKRDKFLSLIKDSRFRPLPCLGTYFQMLSYADITDEKDIDFAKRLTTEHKVASIPPSVFTSMEMTIRRCVFVCQEG